MFLTNNRKAFSLDGLPGTYANRRYRRCGLNIYRAIGLGLFSTLDESSGLGKQIGFAILTGFGVGQTLQT